MAAEIRDLANEAAERLAPQKIQPGVLGTFTFVARNYELPPGRSVIAHGLPAEPDFVHVTTRGRSAAPAPSVEEYDTARVIVWNGSRRPVRVDIVAQRVHTLVR